MAIARSTKGILLIAALATLSALPLAMHLSRLPSRTLLAPEGWSALEQGDAKRAASIFAQELEQHPNEPTLHFGAGTAAYAQGRTGPALASLRKAVALDQRFPEGWIMLGRVAYDRGDSRLAIESMEKALVLRPRDKVAAELLDRWQRESSVHRSYIEKPAEHFRIMYEGGMQQAIGERVGRVLDREYRRIGSALNSFPSEPITVILYTNEAFHDVTRSPAWAGGHFDGRIRIAVGGTIDPADLDRIVAHELVHALVANAAPRLVPAWLNEGLAMHLESSDRGWIPAALRQASSIVPLDTLDRGFSGLDERAAIAAYAESAIAAEILAAKLGSNVGAFLKLVGSGTPVDTALLEFQVQPNAFHAEWRRRVGLQ